MITINLLAPSRRRLPEKNVVGLAAVVATSALVIFLLIWSVALTKQTRQMQDSYDKVSKQVEALAPIARQVQDLDAMAGALRSRQAVLQQLLATQVPVSEALETISGVVPHDVWLIDVQSSSGSRDLILDGYTFSYKSVARFMLDLASSPQLDNIDLRSTQRDTIGDHPVIKFQITGDISSAFPAAATPGDGR
jgi:Tfp pilus assembly protein PilN